MPRFHAEAVHAWAADQHADRPHLWVAGTNEPAKRFYEGVGFVPTGEQRPLPSDPALPEFGIARGIPLAERD